MADKYTVNAADKRLTEIDAQKKAAINETNKQYDNLINHSDQYYNNQIAETKKWADTQQKLQNAQTDFAIEKVEQQKEDAKKDYLKEQSGAYTDWKKQSNGYGVGAEQIAAAGLSGTGFSESSQVSMYNAYQSRVAMARETFGRAVQNYDNAMKEARLNNSAVLAEIAHTALQSQLDLALQGFQYKNNLITSKLDAKNNLNSDYWTRYMQMTNQIQSENALRENAAQFAKNYGLDANRLAEQIRSNKASESNTAASISETKRHNKKTEELASGSSGGTVIKK